MSKSKKNVVDPEDIIEIYGADTVRLFALSDSPPDRDFEWTEAGMDGAWRYLNRLWRLALQHNGDVSNYDEAKMGAQLSEQGKKLRNQLHQTIKQVGEDIEKYHFNRSVARMRELSNFLQNFDGSNNEDKALQNHALQILVRLFNPFIPHITEELWQKIGTGEDLLVLSWPEHDDKFIVEDEINLPVQVNGKMRGNVMVKADMAKDDVVAIAVEIETVKNALGNLGDAEIKKVIYVPGKILNLVK